ncbi:hypothetical protein KK141_11275 [Dyella sp. LX-66]|uniref:hypothetical protein n=1 Tax=unclassified Dyella TaxID=2634549 RepID=UPI001BDF9F4D|nr:MULTISPECIES: hypothetical protein [unclassified Dyella]MBT2118896.1 hypothetical protein [Dyella sp. LX-1]MBT2140111.1 hypothetical protein [Dyella sp. LX-66]
MKDEYRLLALEKERDEASDEARSMLFFKMLDIVRDGQLQRMAESLDDLDAAIPEGVYVIAHKHVVAKGGSLSFKGVLVRARKQDLIRFLRRAIDSGDLRELLIAPSFEDVPPFVLHAGEDVNFCIYVK